jgi:polyisoprenyl-teichoic acid--peptidoglycan teichoic acid transferase
VNDEERNEPGDEPPDDHAGEHEIPEVPPATWAGRRWSGLPDDEEGKPEADGEPQEEGAPDQDAPDGEPTAEADADEPDANEGEQDEPEADAGQDEADADEAGPDEPKAGADDADNGKTIEADTPSLADQEEAREAAMAGLKARTAEHARKRGITPAEPPADTTPKPEPAPAQPAKAAAMEAVPEEDRKPPRRNLWTRFVAASFLIVASMATATAVSLLVYLTDIAQGLGGLEDLAGQLDNVEGSNNAQNFLIMGSDVRQGETGKGRSDTTILLRVDPKAGAISMLSIPRDLKVNIPDGVGVDKFNAAYSYGGPKLTLRVVKQLTGNQIPIHHAVNVDFLGFADAVNSIGCVYVDVDRHYFVPVEAEYSEIDVEAGYQRLCGLKALQYVRYRQGDSDIVRSARQQDFLREARQKVPPDRLLDDREELIEIFTDHTTSDINDPATLVGLFKLMLNARGAQINQVHFPAEFGDPESGYVTAGDDAIQSAVDDFLGGQGTSGEPEGGKASGKSEGKDGDSPKGKGDKEQPEEPQEEQPPAPTMIDSTYSGEQYAAVVDGKEIKFPVLYPTRLLPGSAITDDSRWFRIDGPGDDIYRGYKFVVTVPTVDIGPGAGYQTAWYGLSGTSWRNPPILENPSETKKINGREYLLFYDADRLRLVAWKTNKGAYWVSNSLGQLLSEEQMLAVANNVAEYGG